MKPIRVAIYSGTVPSTTFIERLITGLAEYDFEIILFGSIRDKISYSSPAIKIIGNHHGILGLAETLYRCMILKIFLPYRYSKIKKTLGTGPFSSMQAFLRWKQYAPVVLHLPDIFHIQWAKAVRDWAFLKEEFGVKLVLSLRGTHITISPLADVALAKGYREIFPLFDAFHGVSKAIIEKAEMYGADHAKSHVIYSGLDVLQIDNQKRERNRSLQLLVVGRFHWLKGYQYLLDAFVLLKERGVAFTATLIAPGTLPEEILFQLHDLNLVNDVRWVNGLPHDHVLREMKEHDMLILPSLSEGIANVALEAMNAGLPVISTGCDGMTEAIQDGINGFLVPVRDPEAIAEAILRIRNMDTLELDRIRVEANQTIKSKFNQRENLKTFAGMFKAL